VVGDYAGGPTTMFISVAEIVGTHGGRAAKLTTMDRMSHGSRAAGDRWVAGFVPNDVATRRAVVPGAGLQPAVRSLAFAVMRPSPH